MADTKVEKITIQGGDAKLGMTSEFTAVIEPDDATDKTLEWSISNGGEYASIESSDGMICTVKGVKMGGPVTLTATAKDGSGVTGSIEFHVSADESIIPSEGWGDWKDPVERKTFRVQMTDRTGSDYFDLMYTDDKGRTKSCISSMEIVGGPEEPFERVQLTIPKKRLYYIASQLAEANGILVGSTKIVLMGAMGRGVFTVTKCRYSGRKFVITAYCDAERFRGCTLEDSNISGTPRSILCYLLSIRTSFGVQVAYLDIDSAVVTTSEYKGYISFDKGANIWYILQVCAMLMGCRIWFADDTMHIRDCTRRVNNRAYEGAETLDLYPDSETDPMYGRTVGEVDLGDEGSDTVVNSVTIRCRLVDEKGEASSRTYNVGPYYEDGGTKEDSASVSKFGERTETFSIPELTCTLKMESGESILESESAEAFAVNYIRYLKEPQQSITFQLKEVQETENGASFEWLPYFDEPSMLDELSDEPDEVYLTSESVCGEGRLPQKLMLSTHDRSYPDCTTTYTFGMMKSISLSDSTSRIMDALNKG